MLTHRRPLLGLLALTAVLGCDRGDDCCSPYVPPRLLINPLSIALVAGDSSELTVSSSDGRGSGTVQITSSAPAVIRTDSLVGFGRPARVRAIAPGTAVLTVTVRLDPGQTIIGSVPVTVTGRSAP